MIKTITTQVVPQVPLVQPETPWHSLISEDLNEYVTETLKVIVKKPRVPGPQAICEAFDVHPGQSYNPRHEDHQDLIKQALNQQQARIDALDQAKMKMSYPVALDLLDDSMLLSDAEEEEEQVNQVKEKGHQDEVVELNKEFVPIKAERKTKTQRNKDAKQKLERMKATKLLAFKTEQNKNDFSVDDEMRVTKSEKKDRVVKRLGPNK